MDGSLTGSESSAADTEHFAMDGALLGYPMYRYAVRARWS